MSRTREEVIDELTLALLYLTRFNDSEGSPFNEMAWKNYDFDAIDRLDKEDLIIDPKRRRDGAYKYAYLTEKGREKARKLLEKYDVEDYPLYERFDFRTVKPEEAEAVAEIEQICFPPNEACTPERIKERIGVASDLFLVAIDRENDGKIAGFLNGIATDEYAFRDEFFTDAGLHKDYGKNVMILGLDVLPEYRKQGLGRELVYNYCRREQTRGRKRLVLTCLQNKVKMYTKFGFIDRGEADSTWGGEKWHEMDITLNI
ncbi:MAG: bifunctional helix-turn-helix transcriptional regulator/GNAT family N-acetyltransferase [Lachnospiraceae bacterium]|nr:bifunctional helix-turn-helix transcriptional regulator/GNAT family N-acetyltransferase [Lachnospiraceae bacterium]